MHANATLTPLTRAQMVAAFTTLGLSGRVTATTFGVCEKTVRRWLARARQEIETKIDGWENLLMATTFEGIQIASAPRELDQSIIGKRISELAAERKADPWDVYFQLLIESGGRIGALYQH